MMAEDSCSSLAKRTAFFCIEGTYFLYSYGITKVSVAAVSKIYSNLSSKRTQCQAASGVRWYHRIRKVIRVEWLKRMQAAIDYMEDHMDERITIEEIARAACSSTHHFQRMFYMLSGVTVGEYLRRRRLTLAAQELASSSSKVIDTALKYGYDSPESFAKAFRKVHGVSPSQARHAGVKLKAFPRIAIQIMLKGDQEMDYRIVEREGFTLIGKVIETTSAGGKSSKEITEFWRACFEQGVIQRLSEQIEEEKLYGVVYGFDCEQDSFKYMIAGRAARGALADHPQAAEVGQAAEADSQTADEFKTLEIPASTWAVFTCVGPMPGAIQSLIHRIYQEWFPATGYEHAGTPEFELYPPGDSSSEDYQCEMWIPVIKKE